MYHLGGALAELGNADLFLFSFSTAAVAAPDGPRRRPQKEKVDSAPDAYLPRKAP